MHFDRKKKIRTTTNKREIIKALRRKTGILKYNVRLILSWQKMYKYKK